MNERSRNVAVGLTAFIGLIGLIVMMLLFGYAPAWLQPTYTVRVHLPHAEGLTQGSPVRLHGINVGHVETVHLTRPPASGVIALINIREHIRVPENVQAVVVSPIFGGSTELELESIEPIDPDAVVFLPTDGTAQISGRRGGMVRDVTNQVQAMLDRPLQDFERVADQFENISQEWTRVGQNVNRLIEPRDADEINRGEADANLHSLIQRTDARVQQMEEVLDGFKRYTDDEDLHANIREAVANAQQLSERLPEQVDELSRNVNQSVSALRSRYLALADDLSGTLSIMQRMAERVERGDGTVGRLLTDPRLYDNLDDAVERMQQTLDDLRLLIQKWEAEGVPVQF